VLKYQTQSFAIISLVPGMALAFLFPVSNEGAAEEKTWLLKHLSPGSGTEATESLMAVLRSL